jgi:hypothetical protein
MNTLLHKGNERTDAVADALYQRSPGARQILENAKTKFGAAQHAIIKDAIVHGEKLPNVKEVRSQN